MRKLTLILCSVALLAVPATASAHVLSQTGGRAQADRTLTQWAFDHETEGEYVADASVKRSDCVRWTAHRFVCVGSIEYALEPGYEYPDGTTQQFCSTRVTVRFAGRYSYAKRGRVHGMECF